MIGGSYVSGTERLLDHDRTIREGKARNTKREKKIMDCQWPRHAVERGDDEWSRKRLSSPPVLRCAQSWLYCDSRRRGQATLAPRSYHQLQSRSQPDSLSCHLSSSHPLKYYDTIILLILHGCPVPWLPHRTMPTYILQRCILNKVVPLQPNYS